MEWVFRLLMLFRKVELNIFRDGNEYEIKFKDGNAIKPLKKLEKQKKITKGTFYLQKIFFYLKFSS